MNTIINKYILREISFPFFMTLLVFTFVLIIGKILQIMDLMVNKGVLFISILKMILFTMHAFLIFTIPISLLIAILIGLGRLSGDNEITVMKSSGVSLYQLFVPIAFMSVLAFVFSLTIGLLAPLSNFAMKNLLFEIVKQKASIGIKEKVFNDDFKGLVIYADRIPLEGDFMEGVMVNDTRLVKEPTTIIAPKGYLRSDLKSMKVILRLERGSIHSVESGLKTYKKTDFGSYDVLLDMGTALSESAKSTSKGSVDMTIRELLENMRKGGIDDAARRDMIIELNKKFSIPLSCLVFAIIGIPPRHRIQKIRQIPGIHRRTFRRHHLLHPSAGRRTPSAKQEKPSPCHCSLGSQYPYGFSGYVSVLYGRKGKTSSGPDPPCLG